MPERDNRRLNTTRRLLASGLFLAGVAGGTLACRDGTAHGRPAGTGRVASAATTPSRQAAPVARRSTPTLVRSRLIGHSVSGRPLTATELRGGPARHKVLVVGCIHGDEPAGMAIVRRLEQLPPPPGLDLWLVESLNPDGAVAGTRVNAAGVDLNRNFPFRWMPAGPAGGLHYAGPGPLSEPESRAAVGLITNVLPDVTIWFHQALDLVDDSGGDPAIEQRFARLTGLAFRRLPRYTGSVTGWQDHVYPGSTAFVVELPGGRLSAPAVERFADAVLHLVT